MTSFHYKKKRLKEENACSYLCCVSARYIYRKICPKLTPGPDPFTDPPCRGSSEDRLQTPTQIAPPMLSQTDKEEEGPKRPRKQRNNFPCERCKGLRIGCVDHKDAPCDYCQKHGFPCVRTIKTRDEKARLPSERKKCEKRRKELKSDQMAHFRANAPQRDLRPLVDLPDFEELFSLQTVGTNDSVGVTSALPLPLMNQSDWNREQETYLEGSELRNTHHFDAAASRLSASLGVDNLVDFVKTYAYTGDTQYNSSTSGTKSMNCVQPRSQMTQSHLGRHRGHIGEEMTFAKPRTSTLRLDLLFSLESLVRYLSIRPFILANHTGGACPYIPLRTEDTHNMLRRVTNQI